MEAAFKTQVTANASAEYTHLWSTLGSFSDNPMGIHWTGIVFGLGFCDFFRILDDGLSRGAASAGR